MERDADTALTSTMNMKTRQEIQEEITKAMREIAKLQEKIYHLARERDNLENKVVDKPKSI